MKMKIFKKVKKINLNLFLEISLLVEVIISYVEWNNDLNNAKKYDIKPKNNKYIKITIAIKK